MGARKNSEQFLVNFADLFEWIFEESWPVMLCYTYKPCIRICMPP